MTGPKDIVIAALALVAIVLGSMYGCQSKEVSALESDLNAADAREALCIDRIGVAVEEAKKLQLQIIDQNDAIRYAEEMGAKAQLAQEAIDEYAIRLNTATERLAILAQERHRFDELVATASVCETYEFALRAIAGEDL